MDDEVLFRNESLELSANGPDKVILVVTNKVLANRVNKALGGYYPDTIKEGEEPLFKLSVEEAATIVPLCFKDTMAKVLMEKLSKRH